MRSDSDKEVCDSQTRDDGVRSSALLTVDDAADADKQSSRDDERSLTVCDQGEVSPRSGTVDVARSEPSPKTETIDITTDDDPPPEKDGIEVDTNKVHVDISHLEAKPHGTSPEVVRHSIGLEHISNIEILNAQQPPTWLKKKRFFILGCGVLLLLIVAIIVVGLVAGLVLTRRGGGGGGTNEEGGVSSTAANSACGTVRQPVHRQLLAAAAANSTLFIFGRGLDDDIWYRALDGGSSTWKGDWGKWVQMRERFAGPPTVVDWAPRRSTRIHVFAPRQDTFSVMAAGWENDTLPNSWEALGEAVAGPVGLCKIPAGFVNAGIDPSERIDQWVISRESRGILHNFWNNVIEGFQEPSTYKDWESSPSVQPSASSLAALCRKEDPVHTLLMFANGTDSVRFRHYTGSTRTWNSWVDIGGRFKGDPLLVPVNETYFTFFGIHMESDIVTFNWTNATGVGFRPALTSLGGNFTSMPSAIISSTSPLRVDVVGLGLDGIYKHKAFENGKWANDWEDLGVKGNSAPLLYKFEIKLGPANGEPRNQTLMAAIGEDNQLRYATWDTSTKTSWKELVADWAIAGGNLTTKSMCD